MSQLKKGALLSYVTIFLTNVVGLLVTPFIIRSLGDAEYGLYMLIGAFVGYISVLDFGLNNTIVRFVAKYRAESDKQGEENFLAITMYIYVFISLIIGVIGIVLYFNLDTIFSDSLTNLELAKAKVMFIILIFNLTITLPGGAFTAICSGYEQFVFPRSVNILRYVLRSTLVIGILLWGGDAISLVLLDTIMNIAVIAFNGYYVLKKLKVKFKLHFFEIKLVKEIFSYSVWVFLLVLVSEFHWKAGQVILGAVANTSMVAIYAIGIMLGGYYGAFSAAISGVFLPRATKMIVEKSTGAELTLMMVRLGRVIFLFLLLVLGGFILYGKQFVLLWLGESYLESWYVATIIMIGYTIPLIQAFANLILSARSLFAFKAFVYVFLLGIGTYVGALFIEDYGVIGMVSGITLGWILAQILMNVYYSKVLNLDIGLFVKQIISKIIPSFIGVMLIGYFISKIPGKGWMNIGIKCTLFCLTYCSIMYFFGMLSSEKELIKKIFPSNFKFFLKKV